MKPLLLAVMIAVILASLSARAEPLTVQTLSGKKIVLNVEIANTDETRIKGLMGRESLAKDSGMFFIFDKPEYAMFWMKDTKIPLDMIFISPEGDVKKIHENAKPDDLTPIFGGKNILAVIEIAGGTAKTLGISIGDKVIHKIFEKDLK